MTAAEGKKKKKSTVHAREQMAYVQYGPSSVCYYFGKEVHATSENSNLSKICWGYIIDHSIS